MRSLKSNLVSMLMRPGEHIAPRITGRAAFELLSRTRAADAMSDRERRVIVQAGAFMSEARRHCLRIRAGTVTAHEFRPVGRGWIGTVLVLHGWASRTEHMRTIIESLRAEGYRVVSLDLPGHGASSGRRLNLVLALDAVKAVADWFGPFDAVVGHSFGGAVAINAASGSIPGIPRLETGRIVIISAPNALTERFSFFADQVGIGPRSLRAMNARVLKLAGRPIEHFVSSELARHIPASVLVIHSRDDREVSPDDALIMTVAGEHVRLHWVDGVGHRRILASPDVVEAMVSFVSDAPSRAAA